MNRHSLLLALSALLIAVTTHANWPNFRGSDFNGTDHDGELPSALGGDKAIAWQTSLPGRGLSSPIILNDRVFVTCSSGPKQQTLHVICLRADTGKPIWERTFQATGRTMCHEKTSVAAPSPATDGERIFALFSTNDLVCLDLEGNLVWFRGLSFDFPNASNSLGMSSSLITADGALIAQVENDTESFTAGIDVLNGRTMWQLDRPRMANWCSPTMLTTAEGKHLAALQSGKGITAVDPRTGKAAWDYKEGASTTSSSALKGSVLYAPSHGLTALDFSSAGEPKQLWRAAQLRPGTPSPVISGDRILLMADSGVLTCAELETGKRLWQLRTKGPFSGTPVAAGNRLLAVNEKGLAQLIDVSKPEGEVIGELDLNHTVLSTPSLAKEGVYIRGESKLWKLRRP